MAKKPLPSDDELKQEIRRTMIEIMRTATKKSDYIEMVCKDCGKRQRVQGQIRDNANVVKAAQDLWDRIEGKAATKKEAPKPRSTGRPLEELTDEELQALLEEDNGKADGGAAEEAA